MNRMQALMFGKVHTDVEYGVKKFDWGEVLDAVRSLHENHDNVHVRLLLFGVGGKVLRDEDLVMKTCLNLVDDYELLNFKETTKITKRINKEVDTMSQTGVEKMLTMSCSYAVSPETIKKISSEKLICSCEDIENISTPPRELNYRFLSGNSRLVNQIWSEKLRPSLTMKSMDQNLYHSVKNVIGEQNISKYTHTMEELNITRTGWSVE